MFLANVNSSMLAITMDIIMTVNVITSYISIGLSMLIKNVWFWLLDEYYFCHISSNLIYKKKEEENNVLLTRGRAQCTTLVCNERLSLNSTKIINTYYTVLELKFIYVLWMLL